MEGRRRERALQEIPSAAEAGACFETGHAFLSGGLSNLLRKMAGHLRIIHAHDNGATSDNHLAPGDGQIDRPSLLRELVACGFHGALMLEMAGTANSATTMAQARRGRTFLRHIARHLALTLP